MPVGGDGAELGLAFDLHRVKVDPVEVVAGLLRRDRELRLLDEELQLGRRDREGVRQLARGEIGEISLGQRAQREARAAGTDRHLPGLAGGLERDLRAVGELADDVVDDMGRHRGGARIQNVRRHGLGDLDIEVGRLQLQAVLGGAQQDVGEDRDGVAPLHHPVHVAERSEEGRALDSDSHRRIRDLSQQRPPARRLGPEP